jgi:cupin 2 domain-containing protein
MIPVVRNLFAEAYAPEGPEEFHTLLEGASFRLESIVSKGHCSDKDFWYDQLDAEWVLLLKGTGILTFEGDEDLNLKAGDYLLIPPHCRHRVKLTSIDSVWLALHAG